MNRRILELPLTEITFVAFDTETTGREPTRARLLEIAAVRGKGVSPGVPMASSVAAAAEISPEDCFQQLVQPDTLIPRSATRTHGITEEQVRDSPRAAVVMRAFLQWLRGCGDHVVLVAHNASFDIDVISYEAARAAMPVPELVSLDTLIFTRRALPGLPGYSLEALCRGLSLPTGRFHRALDDARITLDLFRYCAANSLAPAQRTLELALDTIGEPQHFKSTAVPSAEHQRMIDTVRAAHAAGHEVEIDLRRGAGATSTIRVRPLAVFRAPEGATASAYLEYAGNSTEEGIEQLSFEHISAARKVTGGQGLLFG